MKREELRIVSLLPSATEIVCALGYGDRLVGRSHECDFPPDVSALPAVTRAKLDPNGTSAEIDRRVKELAAKARAEDALGVYEVLTERLEELRPTHLVTQAQCDVCAVTLADVERAVQELTETDAKVVSLQPTVLSEIWGDFETVARVLEDPQAGEGLAERCRERIAAITEKAEDLDRPTVAVVEWADPMMAAGNWGPDLVDAAGGRNLFGVSGEHSPWLEQDELVEADPEFIVLAPCGFDLERAEQDVPSLKERPDWRRLRAVREGRVAVADGNQYFNRPGPRVVESVEILAEILHPDAFDFGHEGRGWRRART